MARLTDTRGCIVAAMTLILAGLATEGTAQNVDVKYGARTDLSTCECAKAVSSFIGAVCHAQANAHLVIDLSGTFYQYCEVPPELPDRLLAADSPGRFYNDELRGRVPCSGI